MVTRQADEDPKETEAFDRDKRRPADAQKKEDKRETDKWERDKGRSPGTPFQLP